MFDKVYLIKSMSAVTNYNSSSCFIFKILKTHPTTKSGKFQFFLFNPSIIKLLLCIFHPELHKQTYVHIHVLFDFLQDYITEYEGVIWVIKKIITSIYKSKNNIFSCRSIIRLELLWCRRGCRWVSSLSMSCNWDSGLEQHERLYDNIGQKRQQWTDWQSVCHGLWDGEHNYWKWAVSCDNDRLYWEHLLWNIGVASKQDHWLQHKVSLVLGFRNTNLLRPHWHSFCL